MIHEIALDGETDFTGWRSWARTLCARGVPPEDVLWRTSGGLFAGCEFPREIPDEPFTAPRAFLPLAEAAICHRSVDRFGLLYRLLWRLQTRRDLLFLTTDDDVVEVRRMAKSVSRASHKMKAFVRFRRLPDIEPETLVAWFEPAHHVVERTAPFFVNRFANLRFSILTPEISAFWDGRTLRWGPGASRDMAPSQDALEGDWRAYYSAIFNPARLKVRAMQSEMPKRYWRNLPEATLIAPLIADANARSEAMVIAQPTAPKRRLPPSNPDSVPAVGSGSAGVSGDNLTACRRCDLWKNATQAVAGEGEPRAPIMLVGEQPGDKEDLAGRPFVGPAGEVLDRALREAGVERGAIWLTNAVKHFKHEPRGKRRIHKTPDAGEVTACRWWLRREIGAVAPRVIVALGATAALAVVGRPTPVLASRGKVIPTEHGAHCLVTLHPSYILRNPDEAAKARALADLVSALRQAKQMAA